MYILYVEIYIYKRERERWILWEGLKVKSVLLDFDDEKPIIMIHSPKLIYI